MASTILSIVLNALLGAAVGGYIGAIAAGRLPGKFIGIVGGGTVVVLYSRRRAYRTESSQE